MTFLLDTHIFLWALSEPEKLPERFRRMLESPATDCRISSVSMAEIMIKASVGKLEVSFDPVEEAATAGFDLLDFSGKDAVPLKDLPFHHRDPFDRMLISQSLVRGFPIMTCDGVFLSYSCRLC